MPQKEMVWPTVLGTSPIENKLSVISRIVEENMHISPAMAKFVCANAHAINSWGAGVIYCATTVSLAHIIGMDLNFAQLIAVIFSSSLVSFATASLPYSGLIPVMAVMASIGVPLDQAIPILAPALCVFWLQEKLVLLVNLESDIFAAVTLYFFTSK